MGALIATVLLAIMLELFTRCFVFHYGVAPLNVCTRAKLAPVDLTHWVDINDSCRNRFHL